MSLSFFITYKFHVLFYWGKDSLQRKKRTTIEFKRSSFTFVFLYSTVISIFFRKTYLIFNWRYTKCNSNVCFLAERKHYRVRWTGADMTPLWISTIIQRHFKLSINCQLIIIGVDCSEQLVYICYIPLLCKRGGDHSFFEIPPRHLVRLRIHHLPASHFSSFQKAFQQIFIPKLFVLIFLYSNTRGILVIHIIDISDLSQNGQQLLLRKYFPC